ncbi:MAG: single-stranded-DNA-specific exonuclease RecJ [Candidatus Electryonea clarkiae]|nr:single-stranded-DNA-specific exonuclease RecJ [Candidatus Electryonea clarkiae]MDP8289005.1 single-stranded-DNA-specific exonuclease RecJ [Candidatus Electryonea clarkiae]
MEKLWELSADVVNSTVNTLQEELDIHPVVAKILMQRGIDTVESAEAFFSPDLKNLHDPLIMDGMGDAVERIAHALGQKERICIYGDYDVDGITSVSLLYLFFREIGGNVSYYIPNRQTEGYGISIAGLQAAVDDGAELIITVDCGITSIKEVEWARENGLDMIISDHHQPGDVIPYAKAVVNPKVLGNKYPFTELAGVGVAYKLAQAVSNDLGLDPSYLDRYLDLVAVGTAADIVPLVNENRIFVRYGLQVINTSPLAGIRALIETANLRFGKIAVGQIIYGLAPRLNAVGRLGSAGQAVELMITANTQRALHLAGELEKDNRTRKSIDSKTLEEAIVKVEDYFDPAVHNSIVIARENWHSGVIGIVASRLIERYFRPTVMITIEDGVGKGSARSIPGFDLYDAMRECEDLLLQFGGHTYAAGLTIKAENIDEFRKRFNEVASARIDDNDLVPKLSINAELNLNDINKDLYQSLTHFEPFGPRNPQPVFASYNVAMSGYPRIVGVDHLKFAVKYDGGIHDCIGFNLGERIDRIDPFKPVNHIVYTIDENEWNGVVSLQLRIRDIKSGAL